MTFHLNTPAEVRENCIREAKTAPLDLIGFALKFNPSGRLAAEIRIRRFCPSCDELLPANHRAPTPCPNCKAVDVLPLLLKGARK